MLSKRWLPEELENASIFLIDCDMGNERGFRGDTIRTSPSRTVVLRLQGKTEWWAPPTP